MRRRLLCSVIFLFCFLSILASAQSQVGKLYLNPKTVARESQTKFIDSIRFIPLEKKDGITLSSYYNMIMAEKYILVIDNPNKLLLVYSNDGKFLKDIHYNKLGERFYPSYKEATNEVIFFGNNKNYALTTKDQIKIKLDWNNPHNRKYFTKYRIDLNDTSFNLKKTTPDEKDILHVYKFYKEYYIKDEISVSPLYKDSSDYELKLYKNNQALISAFPYNRINEPRFLYTEERIALSTTNTTGTSVVTRPFCDTIYMMSPDTIFPVYRIVLPLENSLPASFYAKTFNNRTERENFYRNNGWMLHQLYSFYETRRFSYFTVQYLSNFDSYIYDKQTNVTYKTKNIKADSSQYNIQLLPNYGLSRKGDKFYSPQNAGALIAFFDQNKNVAAPKELQDFIKSKPAANTPVIVEFQLKN